MKKSSSITLTLMASMAIVSCGQSRRCTDPAGQTVPDVMCRGPAIIPGYHWVYGGRSATTHRSGSGVRGGSSGSESGVSRGGFGAHGGASSGAHASSGGGHAGGSSAS